ncbi:hypothetical protein OHA27_38070 [Streptomyces sp. NBC_01619]|uniref:hypothetical protein n=1 Tax=Streptomyces sp. NBC_01619 TaxID=2975901 RepID=UPI00225284D0|nr:hypothetical protein [Streptomyces sp. NBC_01619]MCX4515927.1 hypothetical protein [Streptomyces sp. NBC_01619]
MSAQASRQRVARVYTAARRHPWVLGKLGDWVIWFGPYTPAQLVVMGGGALLLIKTYSWWSWLGPVPIALWLVAVWAVRGAKIGGRSPFAAAFGWIALLAQHPAGRIGGRPARDRRPTALTGAFVIEPSLADAPSSAGRAASAGRRRTATPAASVRPGPVSGLAQLLHETHNRQMAGRS